MKFLIITHIIILLLLLTSLWIGHGSYPEIWKLKRDIATQTKKNEIQEKKNRHIQAELEEARIGHSAIEERARSELGMTKKGETFFAIILQADVKKKGDASVSHILSAPE